jgi:hypothetical protein
VVRFGRPWQPSSVQPSGKAGRVTIAFHRGVILDPKTIKSIIEQAGLTTEQFTGLL